jgi:2-iminoacetate synthase
MTLSEKARDFIDDAALEALLDREAPGEGELGEILDKSLRKEPLSLSETASLLAADGAEAVERIFSTARRLKREVYGNRIVLFAPLYVGNDCVNDCAYCGFRASNREVDRRTLDESELTAQIEALENRGHKRLILVFGEHPRYDADFIARSVERVYRVRVGRGEIRRVNINAAPLDEEGFRRVKEAGIGTYQIFMETYHHETYRRMHPPATRKGDYLWRLDAMNRAMAAGCDDVGIGALFGLADWRFEVLGLIAHAHDLRELWGVGPHTISFPRLRPAVATKFDESNFVDDRDFKRLIAVLRLAVPYTGLILTAREKPELRREAMGLGVSQIDAGSRIEIGGYTEAGDAQVMQREQFTLGDVRGLDEVVAELLADGYIPSWCTSCYRLGRTGEHFMEFAIPGFIQRFCTPNALTTLMEYLVDYATPETREAGERVIAEQIDRIADEKIRRQLRERIEAIRTTDQRDLYF